MFFQAQLLVLAIEPFRFALFSDLHISNDNLQATEDLQLAVKDVNTLKNIDFVLVAGDVSNSGDTVSLKLAKQIFEKSKLKYFIVPGNHDIRWNEKEATNFNLVFKNDKFAFSWKGVEFIGFTTAPFTKFSNGIIRDSDIEWLKFSLKNIKSDIPTFILTHYPLLQGDVDNWKIITDLLQKYNIQAVLSGHYHRNVLLNYDGIPGIVNRSTLRANEAVGGYSIYSVSDSIRVYEKKIGQPEEEWIVLPLR